MTAERRPPTPEQVRSLPIMELGSPGEMRDRLVALVLDGVKTATAGLLVEWQLDAEPLPRPGDRWALDEGEGFASVAQWRADHERFWSAYVDELRARSGDRTWAIDDDTPLVLERFRLLQRVDEPLSPP